MEKTNMNKNGKEGFAHKVGDVIERLGDQVKKVGANKLGDMIHDIGDRMEHAGENKDKVTPSTNTTASKVASPKNPGSKVNPAERDANKFPPRH